MHLTDASFHHRPRFLKSAICLVLVLMTWSSQGLESQPGPDHSIRPSAKDLPSPEQMTGKATRTPQMARRPAPIVPDDPLLDRPITDGKEDRSLSPYFLVQSDDPSVDQLPLKATSADVDIAGVIADVRVTQVYENQGSRPLEAIYVFPGSTRAAVYAMKMTIGERTIIAQIEERQKARQQYEQAKAQGKSASLLEQQRPNVFQMNVANIMPGDVIKVEMSYTELLVPTEGIYEFVYPTVVGPRYSETPAANAPKTETFVENPYLREGEKAPYTFALTGSLSAGMPISGIACPTHATTIQYGAPDFAFFTLDPSEDSGGNRDFILRYRLAGQEVASGLLLYEGEEENFFLMMAQPPRRVVDEVIVPREYVFVVDISGSMRGFPLNVSKTLLRNLIGSLPESDLFNVLLFAGSSVLMAESSLPATDANIDRAIEVIDHQRGGGGTQLLPALKRALDLPEKTGYSRTIVVITDGYIRVETQTFDLIRNHLNEANLFAFGIGRSVNRHLIEGMARVGQGEPMVIGSEAEANAKAEKFRTYIQSPVLTDVAVSFEGLDVYDVEPPTLPDVLAERPIIVFGKYRGEARGTVHLSGLTATGEYDAAFDVKKVTSRDENAALRSLWARQRIAMLADYNNLRTDTARVKQITDLGLRYNLLTSYTSFVAIDDQVRNLSGDSSMVKQALPLPQGVSNAAIGHVPGGVIGGVMGGVTGQSVQGVQAYGTGGMGRRLVKRKTITRSVRSRAAPEAMPSSPVTTQSEATRSDSASAVPRSSTIGKSVAELEDDREPAEKKDKGQAFALTITASDPALDSVLHRYLRIIRSCFSRGVAKGAFSSGELEVEITIEVDGRVNGIKVLKASTGVDDDALKECLMARLKRIRFPTQESVRTLTILIKLG